MQAISILLLVVVVATFGASNASAHNKVVVVPLGDTSQTSSTSNCSGLVAAIATIDVRSLTREFTAPGGSKVQSCSGETVLVRKLNELAIQIVVDDAELGLGVEHVLFGVLVTANDRIFANARSVKNCSVSSDDEPTSCMTFVFEGDDGLDFPNDTVHFVAYGKRPDG